MVVECYWVLYWYGSGTVVVWYGNGNGTVPIK